MLQVLVLGPWALVALSGDFDAANSDEIRVAISGLVDRGVSDVTVDLSLASFVGAATLNALVASHNRILSVGGRLMTIGIGGLVSRIFDIADLVGTLSVFTAPLALLPGTGPDSARSSPDREVRAAGEAIEGDLVRNFYKLSMALLGGPTVTGDLDRVVRAATVAIPDCSAASISLVVEGEPRSAIVTSRIAIEVDIAQYRTDEGPCLDAARGARRIRVDILEEDQRFSHFAPLAIENGIHSTLSAPIKVRGQVVGSINLYSTSPRAFDQGAEAVADLLAGQAGVALVKNEVYRVAGSLVATAQHHADDLSDVAVADGVLSALHDCSIEAAHDLLRDAAAVHHESLSDTAKRILADLPPDV